MENNNKVEVKFKLDKHRFIRLEVEEEKLPIKYPGTKSGKFGTNPCTLWKHCRREKEMNYRLGWRAGEKRNIRNKVRTERHVKHRNKEIEE